MFKRYQLRKFSDKELRDELLRREYQKGNTFPPAVENDFLLSELAGMELDEFNRKSFERYRNVIDNRLRGYGIREKEQVISFLQSVRKMVSLDMAYSNMTNFVREDDINAFDLYFPESYVNENGDLIDLGGEEKEIPMDGNIVVCTPYQTNKWKRHLFRKTHLDPDLFEPGLPRFYRSLNLILQGNGNTHRVSEAFLNRSGENILAVEYDDTVLYEHITTNGCEWLNVHTGDVLSSVKDFRLALVFDIRKTELLEGRNDTRTENSPKILLGGEVREEKL